MQEEPKLSEVLEAVKSQQINTDKRFDETLVVIKAHQAETDKRFEEVLGAVKSGFDSIDEKLVGLDQRLTNVEANMVTKNYLDEKIGNVNGRINTLVHVLQEKRVLTEDDKERVRS